MVIGVLHAFVGAVVAIIVDAVAHFVCIGMNRSIVIITVGAVGHMVGGGTASLGWIAGIAEIISVCVMVIGVLHAFVGAVVAVIVDAVACFGGIGMYGCIGIVAVRAVGHISFGSGRGLCRIVDVSITVPVTVEIISVQLLVDGSVAIVVNAVEDLLCPWINGGVGIITVGAVGHIIGRRTASLG